MRFERIVEQHRTQLLWLAHQITNDREDAEDIVQEALLKGFKNLAQFREESQMGTWLGAIVRNIGRDRLRSRAGRVYLPLEHLASREDDPVPLDFPDVRPNPEQHFEILEMDNILLSKIEELKSVSRRAIQLCSLEELAHAEAAKALGLSVAAIKSRIFNGKRTLRRAICLRTGRY
ncbi:MAG TPA: RNA polymerase sigma factor [Nitrospira sp.]|nr:RNA polymerase sigma factor [Nitrospira sp.]